MFYTKVNQILTMVDHGLGTTESTPNVIRPSIPSLPSSIQYTKKCYCPFRLSVTCGSATHRHRGILDYHIRFFASVSPVIHQVRSPRHAAPDQARPKPLWVGVYGLPIRL